MSAVVECPACHESLELPDEFMEGVVCPHCEAAFILKPVLLNEDGEPIEDTPASPAPSANAPTSDSPAGETAASTAEKEVASSEGGSSGVSDIAAAAAAAEAAATASTSGESKASDEKEAAKDDKSESKADDSDSPWAGLNTTDSGGSESTSNKDSMSAKAVRQRKNQGPSMLSLAIGVVISGFVGLYLGYWLLNFFGGPRFHFVDLPLPFIDHSRADNDSDDFPSPPPGGGPITIEGPRSKQPAKRPRRPANDKQGQVTPGTQEPAVAMQPPVEQAPPPQGATPSFSAQELADVLTDANRATSAPGGEVQVTSELYELLCRLAHVATFVDVNAPQVLARREAVHTVLRRVTERPQQLAAINTFAQAKLATAAVTTDPAANPGIVLAGQVVGSSSSGPWQLTRVQLLHVPGHAAPARPAPAPVPSGAPLESQLPSAQVPSPKVAEVELPSQATLVQNPAAEAPAAVTLVSTGRIPLQPGASRLFVGSIIVQPRQALPGYTVDDSPVVWAGTWVTLASDAS
jgi:hypothetical protein